MSATLKLARSRSPVSSHPPTRHDERLPSLVTRQAAEDGAGRDRNASVRLPTAIATLAARRAIPIQRAPIPELRAPGPEKGGGGDDCASALSARSSRSISGSAAPPLSQR